MSAFLIPHADAVTDATAAVHRMLDGVLYALSGAGYVFLIGGGFVAGVVLLFMIFTVTRD